MEEPTRYRIEGCDVTCGHAEPDKCGDYIEYDDYEKLQSENARLRTALEKIMSDKVYEENSSSGVDPHEMDKWVWPKRMEWICDISREALKKEEI